MVECLLAKEEVASSNLVFRSNQRRRCQVVRQGSAKPLFTGSNPVVASNFCTAKESVLGKGGGWGLVTGLFSFPGYYRNLRSGFTTILLLP